MASFVNSFFIAWGLSRITQTPTQNILTVVFFFLGLLLIKHVEKLETTSYKSIKVFSVIFSLLYLCGDYENICYDLSNKFFCLIILLVTGYGLFMLFYNLLQAFIYYGQRLEIKYDTNSKINKMSNLKFGFISGLIAFICWTPYLLKNFPGIMTVDSINQYAQIIGVWDSNNHHPWLHTLIIKLFYNIGLFFTNNASLAIAFYTIAQMLFMAFCVAYFMVFLKRFNLKTCWYVLVLAFYSLVPYQAVYSISMIKDAPFAGFCLLYTLSLFTMLKDESFSKKTLLLNFISGVFFCLFRTNGFYAFLVMIPFFLVAFKKNIKPVLFVEIAILAVVLIFKGPVMTAFNIEQPDLVENLSMPGQQISKVLINNRELTAEQNEFLNKIMDTSKISEDYNPYVSDWFKKLVRAGDQDYLKEHFGEFIKIYIQIGLKYPGDYLVAYRDQTIGYWFPCTDQVEIAANEGIIENEFGISTMPIISGPIVIKINELATKLHTMIPGLGILWSIGALMWIIIISLLLTSIRGNKKYCILFVPALAIFATLMASTPVAYDFRYAYAYVYCMPIYIFLAFL